MFPLRNRNEETQVRHWHFDYFLDLAEQADQEIHGPNQIAWMDRLEEEHDNFRAALDWCFSNRDSEKLLRLFAALHRTWHLRWSPSEARSWLERIRTLPDVAVHPKVYARVLNAAVRREWLSGNLSQARSLLEESKALWLSLGTDGRGGMAEALMLTGMLTWHDLDAAASYFAQSFELYQSAQEAWGMAFAGFWLGYVAYDKNEDVLALARLEESLDRFRELGDRWGIARVSQILGQLFLRQGLYVQARQYFEQHLRLDEGFAAGTAVALANLGELYRYQHDDKQAEQFYEKSLSLCREYGLKTDASFNLYALGLPALHQGNYLLAKKYFHDCYVANQGLEDKRPVCEFLTGLGVVAAGTDHPERAAKLYGAAQAIFEIIDYRLSPFDRAEFDRHLGMAEQKLGDSKFEAIATEGRAMPMEQAIAYALEDQE
jgi:tetratricopeptide (TPR) repeat protein